MSKRTSMFNNVRTEGAILPAELLQRLVSGDTTLEGLKPTDYHLSPSERLNEAATRAWNRMTGIWKTYQDIIDRLPEEAIGTTETRERWLLPLFQELGYGRIQTQKSIEIDSKLYPISHKAVEPIAIHLVSFRWDLDRRNPIAKSETKLSPHSLTQEFLNRSKDHLWGFLSNGYKLRILRDNISLTRSAYVEFDLQAMMEGEAYSDFFLLYLLCHQSRVEVKTDETGRTLSPETCWLEKWFNTAITEGVRALDELRGNVQSAIESLGAGFLSYPANAALRDKLRDGTLSLQDYYHQVLRQVYRLLFVFVAEDRDLLIPSDVPDATKQVYHKYYSTYRIRELARRKRGTQHSDLWQQIDLLFNGLYDGNVALGLPALGSFLFRASSTQELADCELANADLLSAVRFLCYTQKNNIFQPINYRNLGPEELGSVYESLLEMHPEINLEAGYFKLNVVSGSERKTTGSYYTPSSLVNCLLDSALEPVIANAIKRDSEIASLRDTTSLPGHLTTSPEQALLALKICDPACGSGHFLIAAAHRIAKHLAAIRAGEDEPAPSIIQHALRDVISHCIYGVDINPMSVELCKISLWMEALEPGKPLTFLEHHIQCGNSLLGCTPALLKEGIPDAAFTAVTGDDKDYCTKYKKRNKEESKGGVIDIFSGDEMPWEHLGNHASYVINMNQMDDSDLESLTRKEEAYEKIMRSSGYLNSKFIYDAWCAAFVWIKAPSDTLPYPITQRILDNIESNPYSVNPVIRTEVMRLAEEYQFFHWHIAFPDVFLPLSNSPSDHLTILPNTGWTGGFDCVLGNPPWENVELKEQEWFANRDVEIAKAKGAKRKKLVNALESENPILYASYLEALRFFQSTCILLNKDSGLYPLCGTGRINTYAIFAELNRILLSPNGYCGCIVPSGIATDYTTKFFFQDIVEKGSLVSLFDFANTKGIFPGVDGNMKFSLVTLRRQVSDAYTETEYVFSALQVEDILNHNKKFQLSHQEIQLMNPNTGNCPVFRSAVDAEINKYIYRRVPVLINENDPKNGNSWGITFKQGLFNMTSDSHFFKTQKQMEDVGFELDGNHFINSNESYIPLYEAKMIHIYDHRFAHVHNAEAGQGIRGKSESINLESHMDSNVFALPRYWVDSNLVNERITKFINTQNFYLCYRRITGNVANIRTTIATIIPNYATGDTLPIIIASKHDSMLDMMCANLNSYIFDYLARQKVGGLHLDFFTMKQLPVLNNNHYNMQIVSSLQDWIISRTLELIYTSCDLIDYAVNSNYEGPPFIWDEERRFEIGCELDALYLHLYLSNVAEWQSKGSTKLLSYLPTPRYAVDYIMETFPIVKRRDEKEYGEYRTKRRILEIYDQMTSIFESGAQSGHLATAASYHSSLNPPPGPPCDENGKFIPVEQWDPDNWPKHIHEKTVKGQ